uniref:Uncharacterized protein n=1 Tax=Musa acuminata TaxID=4641 RepID=Q1EPE6_MUSAC|nr:hypothetical protein MA4_8L21.28 [Musa acuminata]
MGLSDPSAPAASGVWALEDCLDRFVGGEREERPRAAAEAELQARKEFLKASRDREMDRWRAGGREVTRSEEAGREKIEGLREDFPVLVEARETAEERISSAEDEVVEVRSLFSIGWNRMEESQRERERGEEAERETDEFKIFIGRVWGFRPVATAFHRTKQIDK